jgi:hypothetical protein
MWAKFLFSFSISFVMCGSNADLFVAKRSRKNSIRSHPKRAQWLALAFGIRCMNHNFEILVGLITVERGFYELGWMGKVEVFVIFEC